MNSKLQNSKKNENASKDKKVIENKASVWARLQLNVISINVLNIREEYSEEQDNDESTNEGGKK